MSETWDKLMARCIGWVRRTDWTGDDCARTYVLDDGRLIPLMGGTLAIPSKQCPDAVEMTEEQAFRRWATVYVPGPEYQAQQAHYAAAKRGYVRPGGAS